jgi:UrcA family protein
LNDLPDTQETIMNTNAAVLNAKAFISIAAVAAYAILSGPIQAKSPEVAVKISVSSAGLDLSQSAGARELYSRLQKAAKIVCGRGNRVDLVPLDDVAGCYEKAIADAVQSANLPQLTIVYLNTHTPQDAKTRGIVFPVLVAAK